MKQKISTECSLLKINFSADKKLIQKCITALERFDRKELRAIFVKYADNGGFYKIEIGLRWRIISTDLVRWELLSHESYNNLLKIK